MPDRNKYYFLSDVHLGSYYHKDGRAVERQLVRWLDYVSPRAKAIYFLGDIFDYWFEYKYVVPKGFVRFLGKLGELSDQGVEIYFFTGNHDIWMFDYLEKEIGATIFTQEQYITLEGKTFRLSHGDKEYTKLKKSYWLLYHGFRSKILQKLYAMIHPRWSVGFALWCSYRSRINGLKRQTVGRTPHAYHNEYFDIENEYLVKYAKELIQENPSMADFYLFGHRHLLVDLALRDEKRIMILGDWLKYRSWAEWDGQNLTQYVWEDVFGEDDSQSDIN